MAHVLDESWVRANTTTEVSQNKPKKKKASKDITGKIK